MALPLVFRLPPIQLDEATSSLHALHPDVQLLRTGTFYHERAGRVEITAAMLAKLSENFQKKVRGIDIAIDFSHDSDKEAGGWIKDLFVSSNGQELWAKVDWTPPGRAALNEKRFRYLSADIDFNYKDNESLKEYGPVLLGAGLTNRPVVKNMTPAVQLAEYKGGEKMALPVGQETPAAELLAQLQAVKSELALLKAEMEKMKQEKDGAMSEKAKLAETVKALETEKSALAGKVALAEKTGAFEKLLTDGKAVPAQRDAWLSGDMVKFAELAGAVNSTPAGSGVTPPAPAAKAGEDVQDKIIALAEKAVSEKRAKNIGEAISVVLSEHKDLAAEYRKAVTF